MKLQLFPKNVKFFDLFKEESDLVEKAAEALNGLFSSFENIEEKCSTINRLENECHTLVRRINKELYRNFITPLDREDIHSINRRHHEVAFIIKAISVRIGLFNLPSLTAPSVEIISIFNRMIKEIKSLMDGLEKIKDIDENMKRIEEMKKQAETLLRLAYAELYEGSRKTPEDVLYILQWSQIYDLIQQALESTERLATVIEGITLKNG
ncbi:MAG: DUF47 family protein [Candidatus Eremiobacteraeota bacterium]|nr:DUF47 family protein [Candidatus Eremiobacteraeota bacterium]